MYGLCNNIKCPIKEKCGRHTTKAIGKIERKTYKFETVKNTDGTLKYYLCEHQKPV